MWKEENGQALTLDKGLKAVWKEGLGSPRDETTY